jgi:hypothetical protein
MWFYELQTEVVVGIDLYVLCSLSRKYVRNIVRLNYKQKLLSVLIYTFCMLVKLLELKSN